MNPRSLSINLSKSITKNAPEFALKEDHIRYGLEWTISGIFQTFAILMFTIPLGVFVESLIFLLVGVVLRTFAGGVHFKNYYFCFIYSTVTITWLSYQAKTSVFDQFFTSVWIQSLTLIVSVIILFFYAPRLYLKKECFTPKQQKGYKYAAIAVFSIIFLASQFIDSLSIKQVIYLALFHQLFVLTNTAEYLFTKLETIIGGIRL